MNKQHAFGVLVISMMGRVLAIVVGACGGVG